MTQEPGAGPDEPVGSLNEEAARLFGAFTDWAGEHNGGGDGTDSAAAHSLRGMAEAIRRVNEHVATGDPQCTYCPVCRVIQTVRETSPEVRQHLADAAGSLLGAAAALVNDRGDCRGRPRPTDPDGGGTEVAGVEKIDLSGDSWDGNQDQSTS